MGSKVYRNTEPPSVSKPTASNTKAEILAWMKSNDLADADAEESDYTKDEMLSLIEED